MRISVLSNGGKQRNWSFDGVRTDRLNDKVISSDRLTADFKYNLRIHVYCWFFKLLFMSCCNYINISRGTFHLVWQVSIVLFIAKICDKWFKLILREISCKSWAYFFALYRKCSGETLQWYHDTTNREFPNRFTAAVFVKAVKLLHVK